MPMHPESNVIPRRRSRLARRLLVVVALLLTVAPRGASATETDDEAQFVALINELRSSKGLPSVEVHQELVGPSRDWARQMAAVGSLAHAPDLSVGVTVYWIKLGENVGVAPINSTQQLFDAFVASPAHYQNLVDPTFRYVGVGVVTDQQGRMWTTHRFMALGESATTSPPTPTTQPAPAATSTTEADIGRTTGIRPSAAPRPVTVTPEAVPTTAAAPAAAPLAGALSPVGLATVLSDVSAAGV